MRSLVFNIHRLKVERNILMQMKSPSKMNIFIQYGLIMQDFIVLKSLS